MASKLSVLLVDDDKFLLDMYKKKFEAKDVDVELAVGPEVALSLLRGGFEPDILMLDIIMPVMDGIEVLETIRKEGLVPNTSIIMLTNESDRDKIDRAKKMGIKGYIVKATSIPTEVVDEALKIAELK